MTLEQRVEKLERQNRWLRRLGAGGLAVAAVMFLAAQAKEKELPDLEVRSLTVKDADKVRMKLDAANGSAGLTVYDKDGTPRIFLENYNLNDRVALILADKNAELRAMLVVTSRGIPVLQFFHGQDVRSAVFGTRADGSSSLQFMDKNGVVRNLLDSSSLSFADGGATPRVVLDTNGPGGPCLSLMDKNGRTRTLLHEKDGLTLHDKNGQIRAVLGVTHTVDKRTGAKTTTAESTLTLYDANGKVIWKAPGE
jgi:hypothetical protein